MISPQRRKRLLAWLLAVLVIGGSISPPTYRHAHAAGDVGHDHPSQIGHQQSAADLERNGHRHPHHHAAHQAGAATGRVAHVHMSVLWIELTLPTPDDNNSDRSKPERDDLPRVVQVIAEYVPTTGDRSNTSSYAAGNPPTLSAVVLPSASLRHAKPTAASVLLCDLARHERSGVQRF